MGEVVFCYVAETYLETPVPLAPAVSAQKMATKPIPRMPSFLVSTCSLQQPAAATLAAIITKCSPQEELVDELDQYFRFEAVPVEQPEGEDACGNTSINKPFAEDVLLNLLLWWKVLIPLHQVPQILLNNVIRYMLPNSQQLLRWLKTILPFLQLVSLLHMYYRNPDYLQQSVKFIEGKYNQNCSTHESVDKEWFV